MRPNGQLIFQHSCICTVFSLILKICASSLCALAHSFYSSQFILASVIKWLMQLHLIDKHIFFQPIFNQIDCVVVLYFYFFVFFRVAIQRFNCLSCKHTPIHGLVLILVLMLMKNKFRRKPHRWKLWNFWYIWLAYVWYSMCNSKITIVFFSFVHSIGYDVKTKLNISKLYGIWCSCERCEELSWCQ